MKLKSRVHPRIAHRKIPHSKMKYPKSVFHKIKYFFWYAYTPIHPFARDLLVGFSIIKHEMRQPFFIGKIDIQTSLDNVIHVLLKEGYGNHFVAWRDNGEIVSLRHVEDFVHQYHIRIFEDGEVRGHREFTPECHPVLHIKEIGMVEAKDEFLKIIGDYIIPDSLSRQAA